MSTTAAQPQATAAEIHARQRALVAASLLACPRTQPTHRRWA